MNKQLILNNKGLTLIELLTVVVILGILFTIGGIATTEIIDNSEKEAHISNAQWLANTAKTYINAKKINISTNESKDVLLKELISAGYIDSIKDPSSNSYYKEDESKITITKVGNYYECKVVLLNSTNSHNYIVNQKDAFALNRDDIKIP